MKILIIISLLMLLTGCPSAPTQEIHKKFGGNNILFLYDKAGNKYVVRKGAGDTFFITPYMEADNG